MFVVRSNQIWEDKLVDVACLGFDFSNVLEILRALKSVIMITNICRWSSLVYLKDPQINFY